MRVASILGFWLGRGLLSLLPVIAGVPAAAESVPAYHGHANRSGNFTTPELTWEHARALRFDAGFMPHFEGHLYAQPLYWRPPGAVAGVLIVGSESNVVTAIDAASGNTVWGTDCMGSTEWGCSLKVRDFLKQVGIDYQEVVNLRG